LKHWIANNIFGLAFAVNGIEFLQLNKIVNGCILLGGLFFYDIFWVFGTNVMVTVAKSFDAPIKRKVESTFFKLYFKIIKIFFSSDFSTRLDWAWHLRWKVCSSRSRRHRNTWHFYCSSPQIRHEVSFFNLISFSLITLKDLIWPLNLSLNRNRKTYFYSCFIAYILALFCTIFVMHVFKHAQPALLYIVPLCLVVPLTVALIQGDLKSMFTYRDHEDTEPKPSKSDSSNNTSTNSSSNDAAEITSENYVRIGNSPKSKKDKKKN